MLNQLTHSIILQILAYLPTPDKSRLSQTCKTNNMLAGPFLLELQQESIKRTTPIKAILEKSQLVLIHMELGNYISGMHKLFTTLRFNVIDIVPNLYKLIIQFKIFTNFTYVTIFSTNSPIYEKFHFYEFINLVRPYLTDMELRRLAAHFSILIK